MTNGAEVTTKRYCVCGHEWDTTRPETREHDHAARTLENAVQSADALAWSALDAEIRRAEGTP